MTRPFATQELTEAGQSPWLDSISRELLDSGRLKGWIEERGLMGVTSNPSIFEKAITQPNGGYDADIRKLFRQKRLCAIRQCLFRIWVHLNNKAVCSGCDRRLRARSH